MESKEFKSLFDKIAKAHGYEKAFSGWFKESAECIAVLDLQKSNFGNYYELNIKIFIRGVFGNRYTKDKKLVKRDTGDIFTRQPEDFKDVLDFDTSMDSDKRKQGIEALFKEFIDSFIDRALSRNGIKDLAQDGELFLLPAVKKELGL